MSDASVPVLNPMASGWPASPKAAPAVETAAPVDDDAVAFTIGGHDFKIAVPTLADAKASGLHLSAEEVATAEKAIDLVVGSSASAAAVGKETLMKGCSLGEAVKLGEAWRQLYERAGLPTDKLAPTV